MIHVIFQWVGIPVTVAIISDPVGTSFFVWALSPKPVRCLDNLTRLITLWRTDAAGSVVFSF